MSDSHGLHVELEAPVAQFTLIRPRQLNPLDDSVRAAFKEALDELEERPDIRVVVLSGQGGSFSAGADLKRTAYPPLVGDWSTRRHLTGSWQRVLERFDRIPQVSVAALHGHVIGGAALLAAACDIRVASDSTVLRIPELAIGIPLTWAGIPLLVREVGLPVAREWVMTGRAVEIEELHRSGFVQRVVAHADLEAGVASCVNDLLAMGPGPLAMTRSMFSAVGRHAPGMVAAWGDADHQQWSFTEDEYRQVASAYVQGRLK